MKNLEFLSNVLAADSLEKQLEIAEAERKRISKECQTNQTHLRVASSIVRYLEYQIETEAKTQSHE